ncbi:MAG: putative Ig domain-containing protein [Alphaproteobacteria bacterium]
MLTAINDAPTWNGETIPSQAGREGESLTFPFLPDRFFADVDSPALTYSVGTLPTWLHFDPVSHTFTGTPLIGAAGVYDIPITATDDAGATATITFRLTIEIAPSTMTDEVKESTSDPTDQAPAPLPAAEARLSPSAIAPETIRVPVQPMDGASGFEFSRIRDGNADLGHTTLRADTPLTGPKTDANATDADLASRNTAGDPTHATDDTAHRQTSTDTHNAENGIDEPTENMTPVSGPNRTNLQVGATLREHDAQLFAPPTGGEDEKGQRGVAGYGITEGKSGERGMPGLTSQLNAYGPKAFQAELQDLVQTVKDAVK